MPTAPYRTRPPRPADQTAEEAQPPAELEELTSQQFAEWRRHPVSKLVMERYLPDFRQALERQFLESFVAGGLSEELKETTRGRLMAAHLVETLNLDVIRDFYGMTPTVAASSRPLRDNEVRWSE